MTISFRNPKTLFRKPDFRKINWVKVITTFLTLLMVASLLLTPLLGIIYIVS